MVHTDGTAVYILAYMQSVWFHLRFDGHKYFGFKYADDCTIIAPESYDVDHSTDLINQFVGWADKTEGIRILQNVKNLLCIKKDTLPRSTIVS